MGQVVTQRGRPERSRRGQGRRGSQEGTRGPTRPPGRQSGSCGAMDRGTFVGAGPARELFYHLQGGGRAGAWRAFAGRARSYRGRGVGVRGERGERSRAGPAPTGERRLECVEGCAWRFGLCRSGPCPRALRSVARTDHELAPGGRSRVGCALEVRGLGSGGNAGSLRRGLGESSRAGPAPAGGGGSRALGGRKAEKRSRAGPAPTGGGAPLTPCPAFSACSAGRGR